MDLFEPTHFFNKHKILFLDATKENEPALSGALVIQKDEIDLLTFGVSQKPTFSSKFPATLVNTTMEWDDLVLDRSSKKAVDHMLTWINKNQVIMNDWGMSNKIKPGYRALFYGPPGTGKTLTASLMGKATGKDVYKIDISMISSKWVGETEKNLARVFDAAESKDWILFFDEADSIFGKRTSSGSAQEKHANQEVSYLLQRTEEYPGIVILASNLKGNIDDAFIRRFQSMVYFKMPTAEERYNLWLKAFDGGLKLDENVDIRQISKDYEIAGGAIVNVLKYCAIKALQQEKPLVLEADLIQGIKNELMKEGKVG
jgi:SpoVK/Ycf46/Vps4 family AAA+-type ATPase